MSTNFANVVEAQCDCDGAKGSDEAKALVTGPETSVTGPGD